MKCLTKYEQLQFSVFIAFFLAFIVTGALMIGQPDPSPNVVDLFKELKTLFLGLLSITTLKNAIALANGCETKGEPSEKTDPVTPPAV